MGFRDVYAKISGNHALMMVLCCVVPILILFSAVKVFGLGQQWLFWGFLILCPLMHVIMMRHHAGKQEGGCHAHQSRKSPAAAEESSGKLRTGFQRMGIALLFVVLTIIMLWVMHPEWR